MWKSCYHLTRWYLPGILLKSWLICSLDFRIRTVWLLRHIFLSYLHKYSHSWERLYSSRNCCTDTGIFSSEQSFGVFLNCCPNQSFTMFVQDKVCQQIECYFKEKWRISSSEQLTWVCSVVSHHDKNLNVFGTCFGRKTERYYLTGLQPLHII